jgi:hypothetical protein
MSNNRRAGPAAAGCLLDEQSDPPLRHVLGRLLAAAGTADLAIARMRLAGIDLSPSELGGVGRCRVLIGALDMEMLEAGPAIGTHLRSLAAFLASGRVQIRANRTRSWAPDFSVFAGLPQRPALPDGRICLIGTHYFYKYPTTGPAFTTVLADVGSVRRATRRFGELWETADDVLPVITETFERMVGQFT